MSKKPQENPNVTRPFVAAATEIEQRDGWQSSVSTNGKVVKRDRFLPTATVTGKPFTETVLSDISFTDTNRVK